MILKGHIKYSMNFYLATNFGDRAHIKYKKNHTVRWKLQKLIKYKITSTYKSGMVTGILTFLFFSKLVGQVNKCNNITD